MNSLQLILGSKRVGPLLVLLLIACPRGLNAQTPAFDAAQTRILEAPVARLLNENAQLEARRVSSNRLGRPDKTIDAGDHYLLEDGTMVRLLRIEDEVAIGKRPAQAGADPALNEQAIERAVESARLESRIAIERTGVGGVDLLQTVNKMDNSVRQALERTPGVEFAYQVLMDPTSGSRMIPTSEVLVRLQDGVVIDSVAAEIAAAGFRVKRTAGAARLNVHVLEMLEPGSVDPLGAARELFAIPGIKWAEPNFLREIAKNFTPDDPLFGNQQSHHNTGQNGGLSDADVDAPEAWDITRGSASIVIAIIDDGVDTAHPDLRIYQNDGEYGGGKESNGIDDDGNGLIDDYQGWDFGSGGIGDKNPNPAGTNGHGTGCAGVAAAVHNNTRVAGIAGGCTILPIKITDDSGSFASDVAIGDAISYAAEHADVLSNSWGGGSTSAFINLAIDDAVEYGREGKGCPVFFASGNSASTWYGGGGRFRLSTSGLSGSLRFGFFYYRGPSSSGENAVRIDNVCLIDSDGHTHNITALPTQDFEGSFPPTDWQLYVGGGAASNWYRSSVNTLTGTGGTYSARSPSLSNAQYAWLFTPAVTISGNETLAFAASISMPSDSSFYVDVYDATLSTYYGSYGPWNGVPYVNTNTSYPANYANSIAVGSATDRDRRSDYSQYGSDLDFLAPSNGGWNDIATLDPVGAAGWTPTDHKMNFGGTSSACPLAAGVGALMLSVNPNLTAAQVRTVLRGTADQVGGVTYTAGRNNYYGYGRINANAALNALLSSEVYVNLASTGRENGSSSNPFNTVEEGAAIVQGGGTVRITGGNYPENLTISKPVTIQRNGGTGNVVIGN